MQHKLHTHQRLVMDFEVRHKTRHLLFRRNNCSTRYTFKTQVNDGMKASCRQVDYILGYRFSDSPSKQSKLLLRTQICILLSGTIMSFQTCFFGVGLQQYKYAQSFHNCSNEELAVKTITKPLLKSTRNNKGSPSITQMRNTFFEKRQNR